MMGHGILLLILLWHGLLLWQSELVRSKYVTSSLIVVLFVDRTNTIFIRSSSLEDIITLSWRIISVVACLLLTLIGIAHASFLEVDRRIVWIQDLIEKAIGLVRADAALVLRLCAFILIHWPCEAWS